MRPVTIFENKRIEGTNKLELVEIGKGLFHQFSVDHEEFETGPGNFPVAIVEMPDGKVELVYAAHIRFDDVGGE